MSAFSMHKDNFIFQDTNRQNISAGQTTHRGVEFTFNYQFIENFYLKASGTLAEHKYDAALTLSKTDINGNYIDTAPKQMASMQLGWRNEHASQIELEWLHLGKYYLNPENTAEYNGHELLNLRTSLQLSPHLSVSARLLNLTNKDYAERADFGFGNYRYFVGEPRSIFVTLRYSFR
tara:strand:- start:1210 stop:1740 length:531 start_codon:yes stop_codon:yes gene_type:complete